MVTPEKITSYIFPAIEDVEKADGTFEFRTVLRKQDTDGRWYWCNMFQKANPKLQLFFNSKPITKDLVIKKLVIHAYNLLICGMIEPNNPNGFRIFHLDENQDSEEKRISDYMRY